MTINCMVHFIRKKDITYKRSLVLLIYKIMFVLYINVFSKRFMADNQKIHV